jgi:hypothetical protein
MGRRALRLSVLLLCACGAPPPAPLANRATGSIDIRLVDLPNLPATATARCNLTSVLLDKFPNWTGRSCGTLGPSATAEALIAASRCIEESHLAHRPFVEIQIEDSPDVVVAGQAWFSTGSDTYRGEFMADPCGGTCADKGGVEIVHCDRIASYCKDKPHCYECGHQSVVATCELGKR